MALVDARILRSLKVTETKSDKGSIQLSASQDILVLSESKDPPFNEVLEDETIWPNLGDTKLPQINDKTVVKGVTLYVTGRELSYYKDNERAVVMSVKYDAKSPPEPKEPDGAEPTTWQRITVSSQSITKPADGWRRLVDCPGLFSADTGDVAMNSAGDPVDGLEEEGAIARLAYTNTQVSDPNFQQLLGHLNTCNRTSFLGCANYQIRVAGFSAEYDQKNNVWSVTVEFAYNPDGWQIRYHDAGYNELDDDGERRAILDKGGNPVSSPVPLDTDGKVVPIGGDGPEVYTLSLYPYPAVDLNQIFTACNI